MSIISEFGSKNKFEPCSKEGTRGDTCSTIVSEFRSKTKFEPSVKEKLFLKKQIVKYKLKPDAEKIITEMKDESKRERYLRTIADFKKSSNNPLYLFPKNGNYQMRRAIEASDGKL